MKTPFFFFIALMAATAVHAQDHIQTTLEADLVSHYVWRGQDLGHTAIQPTLGIGYKGFSLSAWGSIGLTDAADTRELDLNLSYSAAGFTLGLTDYWFDAGLDPRQRYFLYDAHRTNHLFEATVGYDFVVASLTWFTNIAGNDGANASGHRAYSSYLEAAVPFKLASVEWTASAGLVPWATTSYGASGFALTNLALRASSHIRITDAFAIPVFAEVAANPGAQRAYLVFGLTLKPGN